MKHFQRLFLALSLFTFISTSSAGFPSLPDGASVHWSKTGSKDFTQPPGLSSPASAGLIDQANNYMNQCQTNYPDMTCLIQSYDDPHEYLYTASGVDYYRARGGARLVRLPGDICQSPDIWYTDHNGSTVCGTPPPECTDDETLIGGECIPNPDLCYDDVVTGNRICEKINPDDNPEGCVTADGVTMCLDDLTDTDDPNDNCKIVNGKRVCDSDGDNKVCGPKNGSYQCLSYSDNNACGYFNGKLVCVDKNNNPIPDDSPDHPKNGGNSDGDPTNDATDARDPVDGGDPDNQPGKPASDFEGLASEKTLRGIKESLEGIGKTIKDGIGSGGGAPGEGDGDGDGDPGNTLTFNGTSIGFNLDDGLTQLQAARQEYDSLIGNIRGQFASSFGSFSGSGTLADNNITVFGVDVNNGLSKWAQYLSILGSVILFAAAFISLGIVMGAKD